jgi:hypothetical protein
MFICAPKVTLIPVVGRGWKPLIPLALEVPITSVHCPYAKVTNIIF